MSISERIRNILADLESLGHPENVEGMKRFGIQADRAYGIRVPDIRNYAATLGKDHSLAQMLWKTDVHEAKHIAVMIDEPGQVTQEQMEDWVTDFYSWDICDSTCSNLFDKTSFAWDKAREWATREEEFVKRAGFVMMATLSVHDKKASDDQFRQFFSFIEKEAYDERNFVKKAVNWALRAIGKRNEALNREALAWGERIGRQKHKSARWIASDALRELTGEKVQRRVAGK